MDTLAADVRAYDHIRSMQREAAIGRLASHPRSALPMWKQTFDAIRLAIVVPAARRRVVHLLRSRRALVAPRG